jgi:hypothetical protein
MPAPPTNELTTSVGLVVALGLDVLNWRFECLELAGYPPAAAVALAERADIDLHVACALLASGASVEQAVRILT